jgi:hypothetical protein
MWSTSTGGATGASVPGSGDAVILDAATCVGGTTCTITVNTNPTVQNITMGACTASTTGCVLDFSANNNNVQVQQFNCTGTGTRRLNMGNGTWTLTGGGLTTVWDCATTTNLTFNANGSTLAFSATGASTNRTWNTGGLTYNSVTVAEGTPARQFTVFGSGVTVATLAITGPITFNINGGHTLNVTNAFSLAGTPGTGGFLLKSSSTTTATISVPSGSVSFSWLAINAIAFTGGATFTATNSFDLNGNTGISISGTPTSGGGGGKIIGG